MDSSVEQFVQHVRAMFHQLDIGLGAVCALTIHYGIDEAIGELLHRPKEVGLEEIHHAEV